jgi:hypothetical protein
VGLFIRNFMTDLHHIPNNQTQIHTRLENWRRYVSSSTKAWFVQPMFKQAKTQKQWEADLHVPMPVDTQDGHILEKAVSALPEKHRAVIRWYYVFPHLPENRIRRECGLTREMLVKIAIDARYMLINRI